MSIKVKGMVHLEGVTYRIVRIASSWYSVVRIQDDQEVGSFKTAPALGVEARLIEPELLREVARSAIHAGKTSSVGFPAPLPPAVSAAPASAGQRRPGNMRPRLAAT
jgi:hypothetical protein